MTTDTVVPLRSLLSWSRPILQPTRRTDWTRSPSLHTTPLIATCPQLGTTSALDVGIRSGAVPPAIINSLGTRSACWSDTPPIRYWYFKPLIRNLLTPPARRRPVQATPLPSNLLYPSRINFARYAWEGTAPPVLLTRHSPQPTGHVKSL